MFTTDENIERVILVGVDQDDSAISGEASLEELEELASTAGAETVGVVLQKREKKHPSHYVGTGKVDEIKQLIDSVQATCVICDDELSPTQIRTLERLLDVKIMDRTSLILDIFAQRAVSAEGKIQVELAQQKYRVSHLTGKGIALSRLGGGIGTRGPGEKKLETDKRHIRNSIAELAAKLEKIESNRNIVRESREKKSFPVVSMVGYTNAGKSTLLNTLTNAGVFAEDKLFATLDTTMRNVKLPNGSEILISDTVGFIQKLPHQLIQAFRATLDELKHATILLHIVDASNPNYEHQMSTVYETLESLKITSKPIITVYNKADKEIQLPLIFDRQASKIVQVSAKTSLGIEQMLKSIEEVLQEFRKSQSVLIPYTEGNLISQIHGKCEIITEEHKEDGIMITAYMNDEIKNKTDRYVIV